MHDVLKFLFVYILFLLGFGVGNCFLTNSNSHACKALYPDIRMAKHDSLSSDAVLATLVFAKQIFFPSSQQLDQVGIITRDPMD